MREQQKASANAQQAKLKRELEPSRLGKALSDTLTRRLIIGVLLLLMVLPAITFNMTDISCQYGIRNVFWFGRSSCDVWNADFHCDDKIGWLSSDGWQQILRGFVSATGETDGVEPGMKSVLWMYVPDYEFGGKVGEIQNITNAFTDH